MNEMNDNLIEMPPLTLKEFISLISKKVWANCEILLQGTAEETVIFSKFYKKKISKGLRNHAWSTILYWFEEKLSHLENIVDYFGEETLNFLIDNEIELLETYELKLPDEWLKKIHDKALTREDRFIEMFPLTLKEFMEQILKGVWADCEILLQGTAEETLMLKRFRKKRIKKNLRFYAWQEIIYWIGEKLSYLEDVAGFFGEEILNFLIDNEIDLIGLGHLLLPDEWLMKIYNKDNHAIEALQTVELRKNNKIAEK